MSNILHEIGDTLVSKDELMFAIMARLEKWANDAVLISKAMSTPTGVSFPPSHFIGKIQDLLVALGMYTEEGQVEAEFKRLVDLIEKRGTTEFISEDAIPTVFISEDVIKTVDWLPDH